MKDIDFDELDKAVSSLMKGVPKSDVETKPQTDEVKEIPTSSASSPEAVKWQPRPQDVSGSPAPSPTLEVSDSVDTSVDTSPAPSAAQDAASSTDSTSQKSIVPQRTSGRFMDIVPASSAKGTQPTFARRRSQTVSPIAPSSATATTIDESVSSSPDATPDAKPEVNTEPSTSSSTWPDPLELHESNQNLEQSDASSTDVQPENPEEPPVRDEEQETQKLDAVFNAPNQSDISASSEVVARQTPSTASASSPFLTDAKVEKRPLGGVQDEAPKSPESTPATDESGLASFEKEETTADMGNVNDPLPEELGTDILAIESGSVVSKSHADASDDTPPVEPSLPATHDDQSTDSAPVSVAPQVTSIAQQYKIKPPQAAAEHAPIYDSHPEPLNHPAKAKSGWLTVLWILGLVLLGAGGAAALYFLNIV